MTAFRGTQPSVLIAKSKQLIDVHMISIIENCKSQKKSKKNNVEDEIFIANSFDERLMLYRRNKQTLQCISSSEMGRKCNVTYSIGLIASFRGLKLSVLFMTVAGLQMRYIVHNQLGYNNVCRSI